MRELTVVDEQLATSMETYEITPPATRMYLVILLCCRLPLVPERFEQSKVQDASLDQVLAKILVTTGYVQERYPTQ
jgi:hypothetical protein